MKNIQNTPIVVMSAFLTSNTDQENFIQHKRLVTILEQQGYFIKEVQGCYKGSTETSLVVMLNPEKMIASEINNLLNISEIFNQESILYVEAETRKTNLIYPNGCKEFLGILTPVSKEEALKSDSYTFDPISGYHFIVKE